MNKLEFVKKIYIKIRLYTHNTHICYVTTIARTMNKYDTSYEFIFDLFIWEIGENVIYD